jgi:hypothetical protein
LISFDAGLRPGLAQNKRLASPFPCIGFEDRE